MTIEKTKKKKENNTYMYKYMLYAHVFHSIRLDLDRVSHIVDIEWQLLKKVLQKKLHLNNIILIKA